MAAVMRRCLNQALLDITRVDNAGRSSILVIVIVVCVDICR